MISGPKPVKDGRRPPPQLSYMETPATQTPAEYTERLGEMELKRQHQHQQREHEELAAVAKRFPMHIMSDLQLTEEERREQRNPNSKMPPFADPLCIPLLYQQIRTAEGVCTKCVYDATYFKISGLCEVHGSQVPDLFSCIISDKAWLASMLQTGHRFVLLGPSDDVLDIGSSQPGGLQKVAQHYLLRRMLSSATLTLICMDGKGRCVPLDEQTLSANNIMGISGCPHDIGVSTGSLKTVQKTMKKGTVANVKPILRHLTIDLDSAEIDLRPNPPTHSGTHKARRRLNGRSPWRIELSLALTFEDLHEPLWMEGANFFPWLKCDRTYSYERGDEAKRRVRDWDNWDVRGSRPLETAYLMLEQGASSVGTAAAQSQWDWAGTEGDCMVVGTTVTKQNKTLGSRDGAGEVSTRKLFFHLQGIPVT